MNVTEPPTGGPADEVWWRSARTLLDLGALTARWLEGDITFLPGYDGVPDPETEGLIPVLAAINRAGFVTDCSQPGEPAVDGWCQRAAVTGFCTGDLAARITDALAATDLVVLDAWPGFDCVIQVPVTLDDGKAHTWVGGTLDVEHLSEVYGPSCGPEAVLALVAAHQVAVFDPVWGRNDRLWPALATALGVAEAEHPTRPNSGEPDGSVR